MGPFAKGSGGSERKTPPKNHCGKPRIKGAYPKGFLRAKILSFALTFLEQNSTQKTEFDLGPLVRDQEVSRSYPLAPTILHFAYVSLLIFFCLRRRLYAAPGARDTVLLPRGVIPSSA